MSFNPLKTTLTVYVIYKQIKQNIELGLHTSVSQWSFSLTLEIYRLNNSI